MDIIYNTLRNTEAVIFDSDETSLKDFLSLYYNIITTDKSQNFQNILLYSDKFRESIRLIPNLKFIWSKYTLPADTKQFLSKYTIIENKDIKKEYIDRFLSSC